MASSSDANLHCRLQFATGAEPRWPRGLAPRVLRDLTVLARLAVTAAASHNTGGGCRAVHMPAGTISLTGTLSCEL